MSAIARARQLWSRNQNGEVHVWLMLLNQFNARVFFLLVAARLVSDDRDAAADRRDPALTALALAALTQTACAWPTLYDGGRRGAHDLYLYYEARGCPDIADARRFTPGCLVFFRTSGHAITFSHVAIHATTVPMVSLHGEMIEIGRLGFEAGANAADADSPRRVWLRSAGIRLTTTDPPNTAFVAKDPFVLLA
jgi:hypothetical protein